MGISTDYRDSRKSAYQEFAILPDYNACRLPKRIEPVAAAPLGVAFVAAALSLGICLGVDFSKGRAGFEGPDLIGILKQLDPEALPSDIRTECTAGIDAGDRPEKGDWIAIWGGKLCMVSLQGRSDEYRIIGNWLRCRATRETCWSSSHCNPGRGEERSPNAQAWR